MVLRVHEDASVEAAQESRVRISLLFLPYLPFCGACHLRGRNKVQLSPTPRRQLAQSGEHFRYYSAT